MCKYSTICLQVTQEDGTVLSVRIVVITAVLIIGAPALAQVNIVDTDAGKAFKAG